MRDSSKCVSVEAVPANATDVIGIYGLITGDNNENPVQRFIEMSLIKPEITAIRIHERGKAEISAIVISDILKNISRSFKKIIFFIPNIFIKAHQRWEMYIKDIFTWTSIETISPKEVLSKYAILASNPTKIVKLDPNEIIKKPIQIGLQLEMESKAYQEVL